ncbi:hypothetical protein BGW38_000803 [Lunasporangiospora selenospora]|uniref:Zn(2)-C6 fungal-type domain-containing protein n=1 Tax=Lunasporangiospora selenospora TaxID=979761 RepID=A0A9P6FWJ4_9FUNG|nr:hypothetical protein BGW38_000803 [Lunasporangiospora selenospora]
MLLDFNSSSSSSSTQKRSKITKACDNCRRRRVKCDGVPDGCGGCRAAKTQCIYTISNTKRGPPKGYVEVIEDRLGKIENMLTSIVRKKKIPLSSLSLAAATASSDSLAASGIQVSDKASASLTDNEDNSSINNDLDDDEEDEDDEDDQSSFFSPDLVPVKKQPSTPRLHSARSATPTTQNCRSASVSIAHLGRHSPLISRHRPLTSLLPFAQDSHPSYLTHDPEREDSLMLDDTVSALTTMFDSLGTTSVRTTVPFPWLAPEDSQQYGRCHLQFTASSLEPPLPELTRIFAPTTSLGLTNDLLEYYFDHFNLFLPIVHKPLFMKQWRQANCLHCPSKDAPYASAAAATTAVVSVTGAQKASPTADENKWHQEHLQDPMTPLSPLLCNALLAVATKVPSTGTKMGPEARQRAAAMSQGYFDAARLLLDEFLDVPRDHQFSAWLGIGLMMHERESNVELPVGPSAQQELRGFLCMVRLVKVLGTVLQHSYSAQSLPPQFGGHDSMVSYIEGTLASWLSNLSPEMRWQNPGFHHPSVNNSCGRRSSTASPIRSPQQSQHQLQQQHNALVEAKRVFKLAREYAELYPAYLHIVYNTTLILLHRPYIVGAAGSPAAAQSNTICTGSGRAITDIAQCLDIEHCPYIVNRFALYALLQAGVIHAMNAVYDKRGSEIAMEYYRRTVQVLEGFLPFASFAGGVAEGIKILDLFLSTTSKAAAVEEEEESNSAMYSATTTQQEDGTLPCRKKRTLDGSMSSVPATTSQSTPVPESTLLQSISEVPYSLPVHGSASTSVASTPMTIATTMVMATPSPHMSSLTPTTATPAASVVPMTPVVLPTPTPGLNLNTMPYLYNSQPSRPPITVDLMEQQKQQLKIQQQHRNYQHMQSFGAAAASVDPVIPTNEQHPILNGTTMNSNKSAEMIRLEQQQQQQQQLLRQQLQRNQLKQQLEVELARSIGSPVSGSPVPMTPTMAPMSPMLPMSPISPMSVTAPGPGAAPGAPVIRSHRYAMRMLQQQQQQQQHPQQHPQQPFIGQPNLPMPLNMSPVIGPMDGTPKMATSVAPAMGGHREYSMNELSYGMTTSIPPGAGQMMAPTMISSGVPPGGPDESMRYWANFGGAHHHHPNARGGGHPTGGQTAPTTQPYGTLWS